MIWTLFNDIVTFLATVIIIIPPAIVFLSDIFFSDIFYVSRMDFQRKSNEKVTTGNIIMPPRINEYPHLPSLSEKSSDWCKYVSELCRAKMPYFERESKNGR